MNQAFEGREHVGDVTLDPERVAHDEAKLRAHECACCAPDGARHPLTVITA